MTLLAYGNPLCDTYNWWWWCDDTYWYLLLIVSDDDWHNCCDDCWCYCYCVVTWHWWLCWYPYYIIINCTGNYLPDDIDCSLCCHCCWPLWYSGNYWWWWWLVMWLMSRVVTPQWTDDRPCLARIIIDDALMTLYLVTNDCCYWYCYWSNAGNIVLIV